MMKHPNRNKRAKATRIANAKARGQYTEPGTKGFPPWSHSAKAELANKLKKGNIMPDGVAPLAPETPAPDKPKKKTSSKEARTSAKPKTTVKGSVKKTTPKERIVLTTKPKTVKKGASMKPLA